VHDGTTKLAHLGNTWLAGAKVSLKGDVFGLAERVQHVATAIGMNVEGMPPGSHICSSAQRATRIADESEIAMGDESGT
jgi:hypothetical protein